MKAIENKTVMYDGDCKFCYLSVRLLMRWDRGNRLSYASLESAVTKRLEIDSIVFYDEGEIYYKSTAVLKILKCLGGFWHVTTIFLLIPRFVRDWIYDLIAKYRYKILGKSNHCPLP